MAEPPPLLECAGPAEWEAWLAAHDESASGVRLKIAKAGAPKPTVAKKEAIDAALCHGWIDGRSDRFDDHHFLIRFTPRARRSPWSAINRERAEQLIAEGRMRPAGLREIERAKADGRWDAAYAPPSRAEPPDDLLAALEANPAARAQFAALDSANRYAILYRLQDAKKPETRAARLEKFVAMLERGETLHPPRKARGRNS